jgi:hypothetical protein
MAKHIFLFTSLQLYIYYMDNGVLLETKTLV